MSSAKASLNAIHSTIAIFCIALIAILIGVFTTGTAAKECHRTHYATSVKAPAAERHVVAESPMIMMEVPN